MLASDKSNNDRAIEVTGLNGLLEIFVPKKIRNIHFGHVSQGDYMLIDNVRETNDIIDLYWRFRKQCSYLVDSLTDLAKSYKTYTGVRMQRSKF